MVYQFKELRDIYLKKNNVKSCIYIYYEVMERAFDMSKDK